MRARGDGISLSEGDRRGLPLLYPGNGTGIEAIMERRRALADTVESGGVAGGGLESIDGFEDAGWLHARSAASVLRHTFALST